MRGETGATRNFDVAVIGAGVVGSAVARELAAHQLSVALIEARSDVGAGTSKANTALLHTGFDATPGTLESRLVRRGHELLGRYARQVGIPVERTGALLVAWTPEELAALPTLKTKAEQNGYQHCVLIDAAEVYRQVPALGGGALGGLTVPDESIICAWTTSIALATEARLRGAELLLNTRVTSVEVQPGAPTSKCTGTSEGTVTSETTTTLATTSGQVRATWVINAAGLGADLVDRMFGYERFTVTPRRGELLVFDKLARPLADTIVLPVPGRLGKGVLISPTIYGNVMLGPTAEDLLDRSDTGTSEAGFEFLLRKGAQLMPRLLEEEVTASYAGLRAAIEGNDYLIELDRAHHYLLIAGIRSTGLTAALSIAEYSCRLLAEAGLSLEAKHSVPEPLSMPNIGEAYSRPYRDTEMIRRDAAYGRVVCFCERVTAGEIRDALASPIPPVDLGGLGRRTRAMNGRCQGFYCGAEVAALMNPLGESAPSAHSDPHPVPAT